MEKKIKLSSQEWNAILDRLVNGGKEYYEFYADIEDALDRNPESEDIEITLNGTEQSFRILGI